MQRDSSRTRLASRMATRASQLGAALSLVTGSVAAQHVEVVQAGTISTSVNETFPAIDPVDGSLWFCRFERSFASQTIWRAPKDADGWGAAVVVPFSGEWGDRAPRFSPEGQRLYFTSNRPSDGGSRPGQFHIWMVERTSGGWSTPVHLPDPINVAGAPSIHAAVDRDGTLWVPSAREGGHGRSDIYRIRRAGDRAENIGPPINDEHSQADILIAPDGSWMIFAMTDHPQGYGGDDLWLSRLRSGSWSAPVNLGEAINSNDYEYGPTLSPDGNWLYFNSHRNGASNLYRVRLTDVLR